MTFGIDVSKNQAGISFKQAKSEGVSFVIVKAAGFNTGSLYVADHYHENIDGVVAAGIRGKGHYYIVGKGDVLAQAKYFVEHLYRFDKAHDVLALDNEPLDSNPVHWKQDDVLKFLTYVHDHTGIAWNRLWLYSPAALTRTEGPWTKITNTDVRIWWSAYGQQPTGHKPDHTPDLQGKISRWDVHQFTENSSVAGYSVDGNYSKVSADILFGYDGASPLPANATTSTNLQYAVSVKPTHGDGWRFDLPPAAVIGRLQRALGARKRYSGPANGIFNLATAKGIQETIQNVGYSGPIDGKIEETGCELIQTYAKKYGDYAGPLDKDLGLYTWTGVALGLERN